MKAIHSATMRVGNMEKKRKSLQLNPLQILVHIGAWIPLISLFVLYLNDSLGANPIQAAEQRMGKAALISLVLSLACTPLSYLFNLKQVLKVRRTLGLYAFMYAAIHFALFIGVDYRFDFGLLWADIRSKAFVWVGFSAGLILLVLALTSFDWSKKLLKKNWKRLHRLVYVAGVLAIVHYAWAKKGSLTQLQGDIVQPLLFGALVLVLLLLRLRVVKQFARSIVESVKQWRHQES
jgi:sulfoxide reductase heme-binding subunit YedZ